MTSFRTRRNETLTLAYDNLNRLITKTVPNRSGLATTHTRNVHYGYDLTGNMTYARFDSTSGEGITNAYNGLGQLTSSTTNMDGASRALSYQYDVAGNLTRITHPDGQYFQYVRHPSGGLQHALLGTTGLFQGQEAPICLVSMTASSVEETPRGMDFLFSLNRINVAVSRAKGLALVFGAPQLREAKCETVEQMRLVNTLCALPSLQNIGG